MPDLASDSPTKSIAAPWQLAKSCARPRAFSIHSRITGICRCTSSPGVTRLPLRVRGLQIAPAAYFIARCPSDCACPISSPAWGLTRCSAKTPASRTTNSGMTAFSPLPRNDPGDGNASSALPSVWPKPGTTTGRISTAITLNPYRIAATACPASWKALQRAATSPSEEPFTTILRSFAASPAAHGFGLGLLHCHCLHEPTGSHAVVPTSHWPFHLLEVAGPTFPRRLV